MQCRCLNDNFMYCMSEDIKQKIEEFNQTHDIDAGYMIYVKAFMISGIKCENIPVECIKAKTLSETLPPALPHSSKSYKHQTTKAPKKETTKPVQTAFEWD